MSTMRCSADTDSLVTEAQSQDIGLVVKTWEGAEGGLLGLMSYLVQ